MGTGCTASLFGSYLGVQLYFPFFSDRDIILLYSSVSNFTFSLSLTVSKSACTHSHTRSTEGLSIVEANKERRTSYIVPFSIHTLPWDPEPGFSVSWLKFVNHLKLRSTVDTSENCVQRMAPPQVIFTLTSTSAVHWPAAFKVSWELAEMLNCKPLGKTIQSESAFNKIPGDSCAYQKLRGKTFLKLLWSSLFSLHFQHMRNDKSAIPNLVHLLVTQDTSWGNVDP